jgi:hypothetical protein
MAIWAECWPQAFAVFDTTTFFLDLCLCDDRPRTLRLVDNGNAPRSKV